VADLSLFPSGSTGKALHDFLHNKSLELLPYYAKHDIKHILLDYDTTAEGEICLQYFMLGNGHLSFPVMATILYGTLTMPEYWVTFIHAFQRGRKSIPIQNWKWFEIVHLPLADLKARIPK
jgi:ubiquinone biosynthesis protein Coq4